MFSKSLLWPKHFFLDLWEVVRLNIQHFAMPLELAPCIMAVTELCHLTYETHYSVYYRESVEDLVHDYTVLFMRTHRRNFSWDSVPRISVILPSIYCFLISGNLNHLTIYYVMASW